MEGQPSLPYQDFDFIEEMIRKLPLARSEQELLATIYVLSKEQADEPGVFCGSRKRIAGMMGVSVKTVQRLGWICEYYGALRIERGNGQESRYRLELMVIVDRPPVPADLDAFRRQTRSSRRSAVEAVPGQMRLEPVDGAIRRRGSLFQRIRLVMMNVFGALRGRTGDTEAPDRGHTQPDRGHPAAEPGTFSPEPGPLSPEPGTFSGEPGPLSGEPGTQPGTFPLKDKRQQTRDPEIKIIEANTGSPPNDTGQKTDDRTFGFTIRAHHFSTPAGRWDLYTRAVAVGWITNSGSDRIAFFALLAVAKHLPPIPGRGVPNPAGWLIQRLREGRAVWDSYILACSEEEGKLLLYESLREAG